MHACNGRYLANPAHEAKVLEKMEPNSLKEAARLAAQAGEQKHAVDLLLLWHKKDCESDARHTPPPRSVGALRHILADLLDGGCNVPWPHTVAELCVERHGPAAGYARKDACLSRAETLDVVQTHMKTRVDPFAIGARVLITEEPSSGRWRGASIRRQRYDRTARHAHGYTWQVEVAGGGTADLPEESVLAPSRGGLPAVLRVAAEVGDTYLAALLVEADVNLYETDDAANTALLIAAKHGQHEVCRILLASPQGRAAHSAEVLARRKWPKEGFKELRNLLRQNAYDLAVSRHGVDSFKTVRVLLPSRSDRMMAELPEALDIDGAAAAAAEAPQPLQTLEAKLAAVRGQPHGRLVDFRDMRWGGAEEAAGGGGEAAGVTTLMLACRMGHLEAVRHLLQAKADVACQTAGDDPCTALGMASEQGFVEIVDELLHARADPNEMWERGANEPNKQMKRMPLLLAAQNGRLRVVEALINAHADVNAFRDRRMVLHYACQYGYEEVAKLLLDNHADINAVSESVDKRTKLIVNTTALMFASRFGHSQCVRLLLERGIDVVTAEIVPKSWGSLHRACANGFAEVADALLDECARCCQYHTRGGLSVAR